MTKRIFRSIFLVALAVFIAGTALIMGALYSYFSGVYEEQIQEEASYLSTAVEEMGLDYLEGLESGSHRITWVGSDGTVLFDNAANEDAMENHADREEIQEAMNGGTGESERYSSTLSQRSYYYALALSDGSVLRVSGEQYTVLSLVVSIWYYILLVLVAALALSLFLASRVSKAIIRPINEIDLEHPEEGDTYEELAPLLGRIAAQNRQIRAQIDEMKTKQQEFATITENMNEGLLVIDQETEVLSYNNAALRLLGASKVEGSVFSLNRSEQFRHAVDQALHGQHSFDLMELSDRTYQLIANPVYEHGKVVGAVLLLLDVTEREERDKLRREFTANVSHELKTPLTSISGFAELMKNGMVKSEDIAHFAGNIYNEAQRLIVLVGDIIRLSQLDEGTTGLEKSQIYLAEITKAVVDRLHSAAEQRGITFDLQLESAMVQGNAQILDEMVYNLCDNAIKYNRDQGKVRVSVSPNAGHPKLVVSDTGIGIPYADQARVFERFYRVDKSHSKEIGGTGLGLSIVKHGAAYHDAKVELESVPGKSTTVQVLF